IAIVPVAGARHKHSLAHELGHVMGAGHEDGAYGLCGYSKAWVKNGEGTIVATTGAPFVDYFSSPDKRNGGGVSYGSKTFDNTKTLELTRGIVEAWRDSLSITFQPQCVVPTRPLETAPNPTPE